MTKKLNIFAKDEKLQLRVSVSCAQFEYWQLVKRCVAGFFVMVLFEFAVVLYH